MRGFSYVVAMLVLLATVGAGAEGQAKSAGAKATAATTTPININTATPAQLEGLPGIGARTAQAIVDHRQKNGGFKKIEDILESSRSCPYLLKISSLSAHRSVARNR